ncbi:hypothetical protein DPX16_18074 [Anabarilius grahami]|uniref:Uncharacterized protein n=1 Tax=Anabarilius grahami TaxID=495550 RepID=A0A3N0YNL9_ANAGA|nr:hypothetical protein DPX16_18074 [Anabarilius grahami]
MNTEQSPPPYNPYYPPQYPNATQGNAGQPTAGVMPPVVVHVDMGIPDSAPPEYTLGFENENCFSDAVIRRVSGDGHAAHTGRKAQIQHQSRRVHLCCSELVP